MERVARGSKIESFGGADRRIRILMNDQALLSMCMAFYEQMLIAIVFKYYHQ